MTQTLKFGLIAALLSSAWPAQAENRALLVGVSVYANLPDKNLVGAANDVALMAKTVAGLGFAPTQMTLLSEAAGALPTRANILAGLAGLARQAQPGDWVLVYLSGHGAQVPRASQGGQNGGMDEVFLPRDTQVWNPTSHQVQGAVRDRELAAALGAIRAKGAHVWAVLDTCHAADMLRKSGPPQAWRFITPQALHIPMQLWATSWPSRLSASATRRPAQPSGVAVGRYVAFFSSQKGEGSAEELLPDPEAPASPKRFGLFTYKLALALAVQDWRGSFKELAERIEAGYQDRPFPTPEFVGALELRPSFGLRNGVVGP